MKYFSIILILLSVSTVAESSELKERIKKRLSFDNCSVKVYNGKAYYYNCKASDKVKDAVNEIEYAKQNKKWEERRKIERKVEKKINKVLGKLFK